MSNNDWSVSMQKRMQGIDVSASTQHLLNYQEQEKGYLDQDLTLAGVASVLDIRSDQLSVIVNRQLNTTFSSLYRIRDAKP